MATVTDPDPAPRGAADVPGRRGLRLTSLLAAVATVLLLAFAPVARFLADRQPIPPTDEVTLPPVPGDARGGALQDLPAGLPDELDVDDPGQIRRLARDALGPAGGDELIALLDPSAPGLEFTVPRDARGAVSYPYRYPDMDRLLDQAPADGFAEHASALGAALIVLAARPANVAAGESVNAGPAAFAVLMRARADRTCAVELDLLLLLSAAAFPLDDEVEDAAERSRTACPDDPTPGWLLGQFQSQRRQLPATAEDGDGALVDVAARIPSALAELADRFPAAPAAASGTADAHLRAGLALLESQPFTARDHLRLAVAHYGRAHDLGSAEDAALGRARALVALGEPDRALDHLGRATEGTSESGPVLELLTRAAESGRDFDRAATAARRLADLGPTAYPSGRSVFPVPGTDALDPPPPEAIGPLSTGLVRSIPFTVSLAAVGSDFGAGASVADASFIPEFRPDYPWTDAQSHCPEWTGRRASVLAGRAAEAVEDLPEFFPVVRPDGQGRSCGPSPQWVRAWVQRETGATTDGLDPLENDQFADRQQNLWRWAGDLDQAERVIRTWEESADPPSYLPMLRLGEVQYLRGEHDEAAASFGAAARRAYDGAVTSQVLLRVQEALLGRAAALVAAGRRGEATDLLRTADQETSLLVSTVLTGGGGSVSTALPYAVVSFHVRALLADLEREAGHHHAAAEYYAAARERASLLEAHNVPEVRPERVEANGALVDLRLERLEDAKAAIERALAADPRNPAFLMTAGFIADRADDVPAAVAYDEAALASDAGAFPAANDLGVELARLGRDDDAVRALRRAVGARPDYALGWFNLGVLHGRLGPTHLAVSQGALARAFALDPALRERERQLTIDAAVYRTALDLSKPLPARWSFADVQRREPAAAAGLLAVLLVAVGLARGAASGGGRDLAERWLEPLSARLARLPVLGRLRHPGWALGATAVAFLLPRLRGPGTGLLEGIAFGLCVVAVAAIAVHVRTVVARRAGVGATQAAWGPGMVFGLGAGAAGMPWAPLPTVTAEPGGERVHWAAPVLLAALGVVLFAEVAWLEVPLTRSTAVAALIMAASVLVPVAPLDGERVGTDGALLGAGVVGAAVLVVLGIV